jgi:hypothetical protein
MKLPTLLPTLNLTSNLYSNTSTNSFPTPSNTPSNGCSPTPHTPLRLETPLWALGPAVFRPLKGRDQERPRYPRHASNWRICAGRPIGAALDEQSSADLLAWCGFRREVTVTSVTDRTADHRNSLPCASHRSNRVTQPLELLRFQRIARCLPIIGGIYARHLAASFAVYLLEDVRPRDRSRNLKIGRYPGKGWSTKGGRGRWHPESQDRRIIDLLSAFRGGPENLGGRSKENLVYK